jgi:hypothetical protein
MLNCLLLSQSLRGHTCIYYCIVTRSTCLYIAWWARPQASFCMQPGNLFDWKILPLEFKFWIIFLLWSTPGHTVHTTILRPTPIKRVLIMRRAVHSVHIFFLPPSSQVPLRPHPPARTVHSLSLSTSLRSLFPDLLFNHSLLTSFIH